MLKKIFLVLMTIFSINMLNSTEIDDHSLSVILECSDEFVQNIAIGKVYLAPEAIRLSNSVFVLEPHNQEPVILPTLYQDDQGLFLLVNSATEYWQCCNWDCKRVFTSKPKKCGNCGGVYFRRWSPK